MVFHWLTIPQFIHSTLNGHLVPFRFLLLLLVLLCAFLNVCPGTHMQEYLYKAGAATFSAQGQIVNILDCVDGPKSSVATTQLWYRKSSINHM